jgi:predicted transcriptional regulator
MTIRPNRRTKKRLQYLATTANCSMARMAATLLKEYEHARNASGATA